MERETRSLKQELKDDANLRRLAVVVRDSNDAITVQDYSGNILAWNRGAERMYGYTEKEALSMSSLDLVSDDSREEYRRMLAGLKRGEVVSSLEIRRQTKDGRVLDVWLIVTTLLDEEGLSGTFSTTERDITERKRKEQELIIANKELAFQNEEKAKRAAELIIANKELAFQKEEKEKRAAELIIANEELALQNEEKEKRAADLKRSNEELQQFAYVASHDLQEPLRAVASFTQLLSERYKGRLDADADEFIAFAVGGANRMQTLINALLSYSRLETRGKPPEPTDSHDALGQALANLGTAIQECGALVTTDDLPMVKADEGQLVQLFQNLVGNAVKFRGPEPPRVHVSAIPQGNEWLFSVRDNGIGIAQEYHERIFTIFQRLHSREEYPGTGIGLALCKRIVERHGGTIRVESGPGSGSTFFFTLPKP